MAMTTSISMSVNAFRARADRAGQAGARRAREEARGEAGLDRFMRGSSGAWSMDNRRYTRSVLNALSTQIGPAGGAIPTDLPDFVRAFVGLSISEEIRGRLKEVQSVLRRGGAHVGWVPPENVHLTLAFLGEVPRDGVGPLGMGLDVLASTSAPFEMDVKGVGSFGGRRPKVIWAGVLEPSGRLAMLQRQVAELCVASGVRLDERGFLPHLTIGRARSSRGGESLARALEDWRSVELGRCAVRDVRLMRSELLPGGPRYTELHRAGLGGGEEARALPHGGAVR